MNQYECIILVIASRSDIYDKLINVYWSKLIKYVDRNYNNKILIKLIFNKASVNGLDINTNNIIQTDIDENLIPGVLKKTIFALKEIDANYNYNYLVRTNLSSFFILDNLLKECCRLQKQDIYAGVIGSTRTGTFCSGAGFWLSPDNVRYILQNEKHINYNIIDDVSLGILMQNKKKTPMRRYDIIKNIDNRNKVSLIQNIKLSGHYHIRIKNQKNRNLDVIYMQEFTNFLYS